MFKALCVSLVDPDLRGKKTGKAGSFSKFFQPFLSKGEFSENRHRTRCSPSVGIHFRIKREFRVRTNPCVEGK